MVGVGEDFHCCFFLVARLEGRGRWGTEAVGPLLGYSLPQGQIAPSPPPPPTPGRRHAPLLSPDWPRPALNSGRLISFTKVKGHGSGGPPRQAAPLFRCP